MEITVESFIINEAKISKLDFNLELFSPVLIQ